MRRHRSSRRAGDPPKRGPSPADRPLPGGDLEVVLLGRQRRLPVDAARLRRVLKGAARALGVTGEIAVLLTGDRAIRALNARYRGKDKPTDVLSFAGPGGSQGLGDVVISVETAARNAAGQGRTLARELDVLALHGFLHVLGYDHEQDDGTMDRLERRLRRRLLGAGPGGRRARGSPSAEGPR